MTLAMIIAAHLAIPATPYDGDVATCGAQTVGTPGATPATPATLKKQSLELRQPDPFAIVQPEALADALAMERTRLLALAVAECVDAALVSRLQDADLLGCLDLDDGQRTIYLCWLADTAARHAGRAPEADTAAIYCQRCGPVWIHPTIAVALPVVGGWPRALGCPWCFVRKAGGHIPRPSAVYDYCPQLNHDTLDLPPDAGVCAGDHHAAYATAAHDCTNAQPDKDPTA